MCTMKSSENGRKLEREKNKPGGLIGCSFALLLSFLISNDIFASELDTALRDTYNACVGIDEQLTDLKKMAGINTAVSAVGTAAAGGALATGLAKASVDKKLNFNTTAYNKLPTEDEFAKLKQDFLAVDYDADDFAAANVKSKKLGNWRTGLMAGSTATNIAGAVMAGKNNKDNQELEILVKNCVSAVDNLDKKMTQARVDGEDISEAKSIVTACGRYKHIDVSKVGKRNKGAFISSVIGASTGAAGTVTSAIANSDKVRDDNDEAGKQKEKNLNTTSNVLAGTTAAASGVATIFNATQISAIKKVAEVAEKCEEVLK